MSTPQPDAAPSDTYYDLPVVRAAPWKWYVPAYFYAGGLAGAAATLAAAAELAHEPQLARKLHWIASLGEAAGGACLVADLGRPERFHHMLRGFRPRSPMNVGSWILGTASVAGAVALVREPRFGAASAIGGLSGAMLATYTGVLVGNTAIPLWAATRRHLPLWFGASSAAALASLLELIGSPRRGYSIAAKTAELVGAAATEQAATAAGVAAPLQRRAWRGAKWLRIASLVATVLDRPRLGGVLGTAAAVLGRFAIVDAGRASAADPRAALRPLSPSHTRAS